MHCSISFSDKHEKARFEACLASLKNSIECEADYRISLYASDIIETLVERWMEGIEDNFDTSQFYVVEEG
jgi:hypothetical protein